MLEKKPITLGDIEATLGTWNPKEVFSHNGARITIAGLITGCGIQQLHGVSSITSYSFKSYKELFQELKNQYLKKWNARIKGEDVSGYKTHSAVYICTLGFSYWAACDPYLIKLGFKQLAEYDNTHLNHVSEAKEVKKNRDRQRLYMINLMEVDFDKITV